MINLVGIFIAALVALYTATYAVHVWRRESNPLGALAVGVLALAALGLPVYLLYMRS